MNKDYFLIMFVLSILTLLIINWQYYSGSEIEATFNMSRAVFILQLAIFGEFYRGKR